MRTLQDVLRPIATDLVVLGVASVAFFALMMILFRREYRPG